MRILIVDDVELNRKVMAAYLKYFGDLDFAENGIQAIQKFNRALEQKRPFDLVSLDIMMPEMDGAKTVQAIRKIESSRDISEEAKVKVVIVTSNPSRNNVMKTYKYCQGYVIKPITPDTLFAKLEEIGITTDFDLSNPDLPWNKKKKRKEKSQSPLLESEERKLKKKREDTDASDALNPAFIDKLPTVTEQDGEIVILTAKTPGKENKEPQTPSGILPGNFEPFKSVKAKTAFAKFEIPGMKIEAGHGIIKKQKKH